MAFSDLEKRKHNWNFLGKHYAGARVNIEQTPYGFYAST